MTVPARLPFLTQRRRKAVRLGAVALTCWLSNAHGASITTDPARLRHDVDSVIRPLMAQYDIPGMAVAVIVNGQPTVFNYGVASREANIPVSDATLFELGSVSKTFTATLAAYAQVLGKLSLNDHPGQYMPQLRGSA